MRRPAKRAFTLMELMVVLAIAAVLFALMAPGARQIWSTVASAQCQQHLSAIYQAQAAWRVDSGGTPLSGKSWAGKLLPYLEGNESVFRCSAAAPVAMTVPKAGVGRVAAVAAEGLAAQPPGSERLESAFEIQVYRQESGGRGELVYTIPLDCHPWVRRTQQGSAILYEVDDEGPMGGVNEPITCDDIRFLISYENGRPKRLEVLQQACKVSPYKKYIYEFLVSGEPLVANWVAHVGESYDLARSAPAVAAEPDGGARPGAARPAPAGPASRVLIVPSDYGLSKGTYSLPSSILGSMDPRLAMVLDYPKPLAEYSGEGGDEWKWDKYFVENPRRWNHDWAATGEDWSTYQSLRHSGRANVLFCDGHIESLGPEDLRPSRALWSGQGR
ncbi:MAG: prepilin-type N-terminal cleavage/methylation domain-containing protein [Planctomycetota bacterium]|nr:prepilin-type N-terminal cleavage/methylation domain-containing protein [Planctomycetota bacterium]